MTDQRHAKRVDHRFRLEISDVGKQFSGILQDISAGGLSFRCSEELLSFSLVGVELITVEQKVYHCRAQVRWRARQHRLVSEVPDYLYGCQFIEKDLKFSELVDQVLGDFSNVRQEERLECGLSVYLGGDSAEIEKMANNISMGGLFVPVDNPPPPRKNEVIDLRIVLPDEMEEVTGRARVKHIITAEVADLSPLPAGVGVSFMDFQGRGREVLNQYLSRVQKEAKLQIF